MFIHSESKTTNMKIHSCMSMALRILFLSFSYLSVKLEAQPQVGFYAVSCPFAETIVRQEVMKGLMINPGFAAGLVRLHFHDCFVRGCDGSVLIDSTSTTTAEKDSPANNPSLRGFEVIDNAKKRLESLCEKTVSCADILAFAARDSVVLTGGPSYNVPAGRRDGRISLVSEVLQNLPGPTLNADQLIKSFTDKGLSLEEMVTLSGAHTLGRSHCTTITAFDDRLYNFKGSNGPDPTLNSAYAAQLRQQCPQGNPDPNAVVSMDPASPLVTDVSYFKSILGNRGLFTSDQTLMTNSTTASEVNKNARDQALWFRKFKAAMVNMGKIGVLTGTAGEIRTNCRVIN